MKSSNSSAVAIEGDAVAFRVNPLDHPDLTNIVLSPDGTCIDSFDFNGTHFVIDWDELCPPGAESEDEEGTPHEEFMAELDRYIDDALARHRSGG